MLFNCGYPCEQLTRIKFGSIEIGGMKLGEFRQLDDAESDWAMSLLDTKDDSDS